MIIRKEKLQFFEATLSDFFTKAGREHLPWRKKSITAYEVWVSEIMLQQTQVSRVVEYYTRFLTRFPTVGSLAQVEWETFLPYYQGLGYYARGRNMLLTARVIVNQYSGVFPRESRQLQSLPGIGPYTAAAIVSFAYGENVVAWDTNLRRVVGRFFFGTKRAEQFILLEKQFSLPAPVLNAALMDFGSSLCAGRPKCGACPLSKRCVYFKNQGQQEKLTQSRTLLKERIHWERVPVYIVLHERHRTYFSLQEKEYEPFVLPDGYTTREGIKQWFFERYGLVVSVRPPRRDIQYRSTIITVQILTGDFPFYEYPRDAFRYFFEMKQLSMG